MTKPMESNQANELGWAQQQLFDLDLERWRDEWVGMPEFVQNRVKPFSQITVRFETRGDLEDFSRLIGQKLTARTTSIWHPSLVRGKTAHLRWFDES